MLSQLEKSNLVLDLISNYSFTASVKLNNKRQAARFRKRNPFYIMFCLEITYVLTNETAIPSELLVMEYDGDYCLSRFDRGLGKIVTVRGTLQYINEVVTEIMKKKEHGLYLNEITLEYRWKAFYGFNIQDEIISSLDNAKFTERQRNEIYTFVDNNTIGFPEEKFAAFQDKHAQLSKDALYANAGSVSRMQPSGSDHPEIDHLKGNFDVEFYSEILGQFEYITELDFHELELPAVFTSLDGVQYPMHPDDIAIVASSIINGIYYLDSDTTILDSNKRQMVLVIGRIMNTQSNDANYFTHELTCVYMRIFEIKSGN